MPVPAVAYLQRIVVVLAVVATVAVVIRLEAPAENYPARTPIRPEPQLASTARQESPAHPLPAPPLRGLPPLARSDGLVREGLRRIGGDKLIALLAPDALVRRFVVGVDNLTRPTMPARLYPFASALPAQPVGREGRPRTLGRADFERYAPLVDVADAIVPRDAVALYWRFYPLLQQAYGELGPGRGYFNDRLVEVIENLLQTPAPGTEVMVVRQGRYERFVDRRLEACSAGQKLLLRMGPANAARVQVKLREARKLLALRPPPSS